MATVFKLDQTQFDQYHLLLTHIARDIRALTVDSGKWQSLQNDIIEAGFTKVAEAIAKLQPLPQPQLKSLEVKFMFVVKDDHVPVNFSLVLGDVTDAEGNAIPDAQLNVTVESDNPAAVAVEFDAAARTGSVSFGSPGQANVVANVKTGDVLLGTGAAAFTVTVGDPAAITGVSLNFEGITES